MSFLNNKVARRILVSFIVAALLPIGILGFFSFKEVGEQLAEQTAKALQKNSKNYAMSLLDRLVLAENAFKQTEFNIHRQDKPTKSAQLQSVDNKLPPQFDAIALAGAHGDPVSLNGGTEAPPVLTIQDYQDLAEGKTLIKAVSPARKKEISLWMAITIPGEKPDAGVLLGKLNPVMLWDSDNVLPYDLWVFDESGNLLISSAPDSEFPEKQIASVIKSNSGQLAWNNKDEEYIASYWKIPMKTVFSAPDLVIVLGQPEALAYAPIHQFSAIYPLTIILAGLIAAFLSIRFITKYLTPLERLKTATLTIAGGDLNHHVTIQSRDEFEELGNSFNEMTSKLRSQFDIRAAMAEIDRSILSANNAETIIDTALIRLPEVLSCDLIVIANVNTSAELMYGVQARKAGKEIQLLPGNIQISQDEIANLTQHREGVLETGVEGWQNYYYNTLKLAGNWRFLHVPVEFAGQLVAVISLGYHEVSLVNDETKMAARNFGDRIAVALSNTAWEEKLYRQAHFDALTGLPNRLVLNDRLEQELARAKWDGTQLAAMFIDLDRFKNINDSLGHLAGDDLLVQVATIVANCIRVTDMVVRLGGDEFVVVVTDLPGELNPVSVVGGIADSILSALNKTLIVSGYPVTVAASIGIALYPSDADNVADLLKNADTAMYHAKDEGRGNFQFYSRKLNEAALENIKLEHDLRRAIENQELRVFYQPKVDLSGRIVGAEALVRWPHSELGMVSPAKFIPLAEQTGLIIDIGAWVLEEVCSWLTAHCAQAFPALCVSVNLSAIEFNHPNLVARINEILIKTRVNTDTVELELTESVSVNDVDKCVIRMKELRALGLKITMDDFGTGYSSLSYLRNLPLDVIKVDQAFVRQLESDGNSQAIVRAILALAKGLGMETVAEGVENKAQLELLRHFGCGVFQGFLFSRPVCAEDFLAMLNQERGGSPLFAAFYQ